MSPPPVLLRGTFAESPLPELLVTLLDRNLAGTLVVQEADGSKSAVLVTRGAPAKARLAHNPVYLGEVLVDLGVIDEPTRRSTLDEALETRRPHGQVLLAKGRADDTSLYVALREQLHRQVLALSELPGDTAFGLYQVNYLDSWGPTSEWRVKPLPLVWRALSDKVPLARVDALVARLGQRELRMRFEAPVARYRLDRNESALVNILRAKPQPLQQLLASGIGSDERVRRAVYALVLTRQLELGPNMDDPVGTHEPPESPQSIPPPAMRPKSRAPVPPGHAAVVATHADGPPSQPTRAPAATGRRNPEEVQAFRKEVEARAAHEPANYYELIGVERTADTSTIRGAFFQLAKRWHPDRLTEELADLREVVTKTFAHMSEAHQVLTDEDQRKKYDGLLESGGVDEQEQVLIVLRASAAFQKAEILVKKRDFAGALEEARRAYEGDSAQAEYGALYAHLASRDSTDVLQLLKILDDAVEREPDNVRIRWYRGQLLKKAGNEARAMRDFKHIVNLKPHHVEALREIRLYEMRKHSDPNFKKVPSDPKMKRPSSSPANPKGPDSTKKSGMFGWLKK